MAFAFGLNLSFSRLGSVVAGLVEPKLAEKYYNTSHGIGPALWVGFAFCMFSWFCGVGIVCCEIYADKKDGKKAQLSEEDKFKCR